MKRYAHFLAAVPVLALGCSPAAQGGGGAGGSPVSSTAPLRYDRAPSCDLCSAALDGGASGTLCHPSHRALDRLLTCACDTKCASVCGDGAPGNCLAAWGGNPPLACKKCLVSATGCRSPWTACLADDGSPPPPSDSSSASSGSACSCDPALPLCPGGGSCATPGAHDEPGNESCGSARYCAPCCDPGDACGVQGTCQMTRLAQAPCAADYECCSGVCAAGACEGVCGVVISF